MFSSFKLVKKTVTNYKPILAFLFAQSPPAAPFIRHPLAYDT